MVAPLNFILRLAHDESIISICRFDLPPTTAASRLWTIRKVKASCCVQNMAVIGCAHWSSIWIDILATMPSIFEQRLMAFGTNGCRSHEGHIYIRFHSSAIMPLQQFIWRSPLAAIFKLLIVKTITYARTLVSQCHFKNDCSHELTNLQESLWRFC